MLNPASSPIYEVPQHVLQEQDNFEDDPKFCHLTLTNAAPAELEEEALLSEISDLEKREAAIEIESARLLVLRDSYIARIDQELTLTQISQERIASAIAARKRVLSPVRRLPAEILQLIFLFTLESVPQQMFDDDFGWWKFTTPCYTLLPLQLVCHQWRNTVVDFPQLWSTIYTQFPVFDNTHWQAEDSNLISRIRLHLYRSKSCPLSIALYPRARQHDTVPSDLIAILLPHAPRITALHLFLEYSQICDLSTFAKELRSLTILTIANTTFEREDESADQEFEPQSLFEACTRLQHVNFRDVRYPSARIALPKTSVTSISATHPYLPDGKFYTGTTATEIHGILRDYPNLQHLLFTMEDDHRYLDEWNMVIAHNLVSLDITHFPRAETQVQDVLDKLTAPSLTEFRLAAEPGLDSSDRSELFSSILDMLERSNCPLQHFEYHSTYILPAHVTRLLQCTGPTLEYLALEDTASCERGMMTALVSALYMREQDMPAPHLRHLSVVGPVSIDRGTGEQFYVDSFIAMVLMRQSIAPLRRLHVGWGPGGSDGYLLDDVKEGLQRLRKMLEWFTLNGGLDFTCYCRFVQD
ncbi:hypothetical protein CYLTODRAFT_424524, partial [Cylindrobasidium torrendii FP15055 ss-10]